MPRGIKIRVGNEAVAVQQMDKLFVEITAAVAKLRGKEVTNEDLRKSGIQEAIQKRTHIKTTLSVTDVPWTAFVTVPKLDRNHPLLNQARRNEFSDTDMMKVLSRTPDLVKGSVDLEASTVHGVFEEFDNDIVISQNLFLTNKLTDQEVAAIICHEVGHIWTYCRMVGGIVTMNHAIDATVRGVFGTEDPVQKKQFIDSFCKLRGVDVEDRQALAQEASKQGLATILLQREIDKSVSATGSSLYDETAFEQLADQWATRHGGGIHLVTANDKLNRLSGDPVYRGGIKFYTYEVAKTVAFTAVATLGGVTGLLVCGMLSLQNPHRSEYDNPKERAERVKRDLTAALKDRKLPSQRKEALLKDIELIDAIIKDMEPRDSFMQIAWRLLSTNTRKQLSQKELQQNIERLLNNDLFASAARFSTLGD